jgi:hypothetical protein
MIRSSLATNSSHAFVYLEADGGLWFTRRVGIYSYHQRISGGPGPYWLKLVRRGDVVSAYESPDGASWAYAQNASLPGIGSTAYFGIATTSLDAGALATARVDSVHVSRLPHPFVGTDIGSPPTSGSASYDYPSDSYTVTGTGSVAGTSDSFQYVYRNWTGDGQFVVRVNSGDHANGQGGIMLRGSSAANAPHAYIYMRGTGKVAFTRRAGLGTNSLHTSGVSSTSPVWLALERFGAQVDAYRSTNGSDWTLVMSSTLSGLDDTVLVGLAVAGAAPGSANFDSITMVPSDVPVALDAWLDKWLDNRWSGDSALTLIQDIHPQGIEMSDVEALLLGGRAEYTSAPQPAGQLTPDLPIDCQHVDHSTEYYMYVPSNYDRMTQTPLVVVGHGGSECRNLEWVKRNAVLPGMNPWIPLAEQHGFLIVAPLTDRCWGQTGNSILFSTLSQVQRDYNVDPNCVYITGHSMGGHLTWRSGIYLGDRWGAISPMSGGYDYVADGQVENLFNVPGFATWGEHEPYDIEKHNRKIRDWMEDHGFPWENWEKQGGGHAIFPEYIDDVWNLFAVNTRNLYRKAVFARASGRLQNDTPDWRECWAVPNTWEPQRPIPASTFHWLRLRPLENKSTVQRVWAVNTGNNTFEITSENARELRLYLHPNMVDFSSPVVVVVNGETVFNRLVRSNLTTMLNLAREFDDRGRVFYAAIDVVVATDVAPHEPSYYDVNNDGCVDRTDLNIILTDIRGPVPHNPSYDLNGDGAVNIADARYLVTRFTNPRGAPCY